MNSNAENNIEYSLEEIKAKISYYKSEISKYEENKKTFTKAVLNIDSVLEKLNSVNILMQNVIVSKKQYDDGFLLNTINNLSIIRTDFISYCELYSGKINELNDCISSLKGMLNDE